jgi:putative polyhydroxyalkanoate system protein
MELIMPRVKVSQSHNLSMEQARAAVDVLCAKLESKLGVKSHWEGNNLRLERTGVKGKLTLEPSSALIELELGMMLAPMKAQVEEEVAKQLKRCLAD